MPLPSPVHLEFLAVGKSSVVYGIDNETVLKEYTEFSDNVDVVERQAYDRLHMHINIAKYYGATENGSIVLERGLVLRQICRQANADRIPLRTKYRWLKHFARGLSYMHDHGIVHSDVGSHNAILVDRDRLKIIDFEGCSIDGAAASSCYEWFSYKPSIPRVSSQTDIFAYGCMVYEVITGRPPYEELQADEHRTHRVEERYRNNDFPNTGNLPLDGLMQGCWHGTIGSMMEVIQILQTAMRRMRLRSVVARLAVRRLL